MELLPLEISTLIFGQVGLHDKLQCNLVNRSWHQIVCIQLYSALNFTDNPTKFQGALDLFDRNKEYGLHVHTLQLQGIYLDSYTLLSLPTLFPNLRQFEWHESKDLEIEKFDLPTKVYQQQFQKWKWMCHVSTITDKFQLIPALLMSTRLTHLTSISICFARLGFQKAYISNNIAKIRSDVKGFIRYIGSAPIVEHLRLTDLAIDLFDMEDLHAHTPNLQRLDLDNVWLLSSENFVTGVSGIKELKIKLVADSVREMDKIGTSMVSWLQYIQCKYNRLEEISILAPQTDIEPIRVINTFEHSIATMVSVINTNLASYGIGVFPLTKTIMDAIDDRNLQLKKITIDDDYGGFKDQLEIILSSKQSKSIKHLEILSYRDIRMNDRTLYRFLHTLPARLPSLQHLCISMRIGSGLFLQLLIHLSKLDVLEVEITCLGHVSSRIEVPMCTIKRLYIRMYAYQGFNVKEINNIIRFAIQSCPMLEEFHISGCCYSLSGTVNLWFLDNPLLKLIHVDFGQPDYYTFSMLHGDEEYKDGKHICKLADRNSFNIDIGWRGENVILDLKCTE